MLFNLNETVRVKLKPEGIEILRKRHEEYRSKIPSFGEFKPPVTDEEGWSKWQLWDFMRTFGPHISMGRIPSFETTIDIPEKKS